MTDNIIPFNGITRLDMPAGLVCDRAKEQLDDGGVVIIGWDEDGELYFSSSIGDGGEVLWLLEKAKLALLTIEVPND